MNYFDLHCDTLTACMEQNEGLHSNQRQLSLERGGAYHPWFQCFAVFVPDSLRGQAAADFFDRACAKLTEEQRKNKNRLLCCRTAQDFDRVEREGLCGAVLTVESGAALAGDPARAELLAQRGVKALTLTWNGTNELGDGAGVERPTGLTKLGRRVLSALESAGIAADVSHASDPLFEDVAKLSRRPFWATHSNARALCPHPRNLTDAQFCEIVRRGGLVGVCFVPRFLNPDPEKAGPHDVVRHIEYFLSLGGENAVALGSDFDGTSLPAGVLGVEFPLQLAEMLLRLNYPESLVRKIFYQNARDFFRTL